VAIKPTKPIANDHFFSAQLLRTGGAGRLRRHLRELAKHRKSTVGQVLVELVEAAWERECKR
jgi:hypothetical protein